MFMILVPLLLQEGLLQTFHLQELHGLPPMVCFQFCFWITLRSPLNQLFIPSTHSFTHPSNNLLFSKSLPNLAFYILFNSPSKFCTTTFLLHFLFAKYYAFPNFCQITFIILLLFLLNFYVNICYCFFLAIFVGRIAISEAPFNDQILCSP